VLRVFASPEVAVSIAVVGVLRGGYVIAFDGRFEAA
jgi:hypothetical protein